MITLTNICKAYRTSNGWNQVLDNVSVHLPTGKNIGILGLNGSGKSTLLRIIGNMEPYDSGNLIKNVRTSWPIGFSGGFQSNLSGRGNTEFIARIYGADVEETVAFVSDFSELDQYYNEPVRTYSAGMRSRLNFTISLALHFDCYLVDEATATGDRRFVNKYRHAFNELQNKASMIMVSHQISTIKEYSDMAAVLHNGKLECFEDLEEGLEFYEHIGQESRIERKQPRKENNY